MAIYIFDQHKGCMVDKKTGEPMLSAEERQAPVRCPQVQGDMEGYQSPVDGSWVEGRRARRYDLEKNNAVDARELSAPKKLKNERFIKKHNLQHLS